MLDDVINSIGGLHNRATHTILLEPFTLKETEAYFKTFGFRYERQLWPVWQDHHCLRDEIQPRGVWNHQGRRWTIEPPTSHIQKSHQDKKVTQPHLYHAQRSVWQHLRPPHRQTSHRWPTLWIGRDHQFWWKRQMILTTKINFFKPAVKHPEKLRDNTCQWWVSPSCFKRAEQPQGCPMIYLKRIITSAIEIVPSWLTSP